jgi:hypothetical protein
MTDGGSGALAPRCDRCGEPRSNHTTAQLMSHELGSGAGATGEAPRYFKVPHLDSGATPHYFVVCDEGWRQTIVAERMYEWAADWLLSIIDGQPFANGFRP